MNRVFKYAVKLADVLEIDFPVGAKILLVEPRGLSSEVCIWALVDEDAPEEERMFLCLGTGQPVPTGVTHVASWQAPPCVWHLFEKDNHG